MKGNITITAGWAGWLASVAIVAIRAFQPGAEPMSEWSALSWALMTLPATWPVLLWLAFLLMALISCAFRKP
jgi:hypothetical protein